jgi:hypothetical protein
MTEMAIIASTLAEVLGSVRFDLSNEKATQAEIETFLREHSPAVEVSREHRLGPGDIPDFLIAGAIVLEVKGRRTTGPLIHGQLRRYAKYDQVRALILATNRAVVLPRAINDRPVFTVSLGGAWL